MIKVLEDLDVIEKYRNKGEKINLNSHCQMAVQSGSGEQQNTGAISFF